MLTIASKFLHSTTTMLCASTCLSRAGCTITTYLFGQAYEHFHDELQGSIVVVYDGKVWGTCLSGLAPGHFMKGWKTTSSGILSKWLGPQVVLIRMWKRLSCVGDVRWGDTSPMHRLLQMVVASIAALYMWL